MTNPPATGKQSGELKAGTSQVSFRALSGRRRMGSRTPSKFASCSAYPLKRRLCGQNLALLGGEFREKVFDRRPIFFGSIGVLVFSERRGSMDACHLRDELAFFDRWCDIENGFSHCNLFWILGRGYEYGYRNQCRGFPHG
jgi:hypothetical protein